MKQLILLAFIGIFLTEVHGYPSSLAFGKNDNLNETKEETRTVCQSQECKKIAKMMLDNMNKSVDPCDDFYEYACGEYPIHNLLPEGSRKLNLWYSLRNKVNLKIKEIMDAGPKDNDLFAVQLGKRWYKSCMNTDAMENQRLDPLVSTISRIGGWPMIMDPDEWDEEEYSWQKVDDQYMRLTGKNAFHDVYVRQYIKNGGYQATVYISNPHLPLGTRKFLSLPNRSEEERDRDEDSSDEENQSDEKGNSQEPGSEGEDDSKDGENDHEDEDYDNNEDENNADNEINDDEKDEDRDAKKNDIKKETVSKIGYKRNRQLGHKNEHKKNGTQITKRHNKTKQQRIKRRATINNKSTKVNDKHIQHSTHRENLRARKSKGNHARKMHRQSLEKNLDNVESTETSTMSQDTTEEIDEEEIDLKPYIDYISKIARAVANARGIEVSKENIEEDIEDMIKFQMKLLDIIGSKNYFDEELTLKDFQEWYDKNNPETDHSKINWVYKIEELFDEAHAPVDENLKVKVTLPDYFKNLISLLDKTPSRTIVNYIHWNFISGIIKTTTSELREMYNAWKKEYDEDNKEDNNERSDICMKEIEMENILSYEYVRKHFSDDITKTAIDMLDDIQKEVEYQIKESDWMDDNIKDITLAKLVKMDKLIGYPDWYKNTTIVKRYFQGLIIGTSYYENTLSYARYTKWKELRNILDIKDIDKKTEWLSDVDPATVNAFYVPAINFLIITAADFQSPFFDYNRPQAVNFGFLGFTMAHEVNHGFDNYRFMFDKNGELIWAYEMLEAYEKRAECFVEQFNNYSMDNASNMKIDNYGEQTTPDNIADTMGLQTVYRAYQRRERECGKQNIVLPGLEDVTNDQLFFLSFANLWCEVVNPQYAMLMAQKDVHSTGRLRVIGSVSNIEDFSKAYHCPVGSPMNPEKKCNIWK